MPRKNNLLLIKLEGLEKEEILKDMGFQFDHGFLTKDGKRVKSSDGSAFAKVEDIKAIVPGSLEVITDLSEAETYFSDY